VLKGKGDKYEERFFHISIYFQYKQGRTRKSSMRTPEGSSSELNDLIEHDHVVNSMCLTT